MKYDARACQFNMDTGCVELLLRDRRKVSINCTGGEDVPDGNFTEDWGDCLYLQPILHHGERKTRTVEITILPSEETNATEFYLMSLIMAG